MRIHVLSDLHIEFGDFVLPRVDADVLIFAGDIHTKLNGIRWIKANARTDIPIIYIMGNHEFYGESYPRLIEKIKAEAERTNIHVLENESVSIDGYQFFGCTLWTDLALFGDPVLGGLAAMAMNDYRRIRVSPSYKKLTPKDTRAEHMRSLIEMEKFFETADPRKTIVITHHAPSIRSVPEKYQNEPISSAFASNLETFISKHEPNLWIHGHMHESQDYAIGETRVIANPRGYIHELNPKFDPEFAISLP